MLKASEMRNQRVKLLDEAREIVERAEAEKRNLTPEQDERQKAIVAECDRLAQNISRLERFDAIERNGPEPSERRSVPLPHEDINNVGSRHRYSILRAVRALSSNGAEAFVGLEAEVSQEIQRRTGKLAQARGFLMPHRLGGPETFEARKRLSGGVESRALDSTAGTGAVPTVLDKDWIELLRNAARVKEAGARDIIDLQGKFAIPRQSGQGTSYWVAESGAPTGSNQTLDQVLFTPHTIGAFTDISRRFLELANIENGDEFVKADLTRDLAIGIDLAAINGSGSSNQPLGILQNTGITTGNTVALGTNGAAPTWSSMVSLFSTVAAGNATQLGEFSYMGSAAVQGTLATTSKTSAGYPVFLLEDDKVYGKRFLQTQQVPDNLTKGSGTNLSAVIGGVWNQMVIAYWSGVDILVDPYTSSSSGTVRVVALQDLDIQVRHDAAFAVILDMITNQ